jgi:hypothetical protein
LTVRLPWCGRIFGQIGRLLPEALLRIAQMSDILGDMLTRRWRDQHPKLVPEAGYDGLLVRCLEQAAGISA